MILDGCAKPYNPFRIPTVELRDRIRNIAIAPLAAPAAMIDPEYTRGQIEPILIERLQAGGYNIVPSQESEMLWREAAADVGGVFDPINGKIDEKRFQAVEAAVHRDLQGKHKVDAVLQMRITAVPLYLVGSKVSYCGTADEPVYWPGGIPSLELATIVVALCLNAELYDLEGRELYGIRYGLETVETYFRQTRAVRPVNERLRDRQRLVQAVEQTIGPLRDAGRAK